MSQELHLVRRELATVERKPVLAALVDDLRRAADLEQRPSRRDALATLHAALHMGLLDPKSEDVSAEDAASFRQGWRIER